MEPIHIDLFPNEILINILSYAHNNYDNSEISRISLVCKKWNEIITANFMYIPLAKKLTFTLCTSPKDFWEKINQPTNKFKTKFIELLTKKNVDFTDIKIWGKEENNLPNLAKQIKLFAYFIFINYSNIIKSCNINSQNKGLLYAISRIRSLFDSKIESTVFEITQFEIGSKNTKEFLKNGGSELLAFFNHQKNKKRGLSESIAFPQKKLKVDPKNYFLESQKIRYFMMNDSFDQCSLKDFEIILQENIDSNDELLKSLELSNTDFSKKFFISLFHFLFLESFSRDNPISCLENINRILKYTNFDLTPDSFFIKQYCLYYIKNNSQNYKIINLLKILNNFHNSLEYCIGLTIKHCENFIPTSLLNLISLIPNDSENNKISSLKKEIFDTVIKQKMQQYKIKYFNKNESELYYLIANERDSIGCTPLHYFAAFCKDLYYVKALVEMGADVNAHNKSGQTPLHYFAISSFQPHPMHLKTLDYLFANGANIFELDGRGNMPLHKALWMHEKSYASWLINKYIESGFTDTLISNNYFHQSPLLLAAWQPEITALLLPYIYSYKDGQRICGKQTSFLEFSLMCLDRNLPKIESLTETTCLQYLEQILGTGFFDIEVSYSSSGHSLLTFAAQWMHFNSFRKNIWRIIFNLKPNLHLYSKGNNNFLNNYYFQFNLNLIEDDVLAQIIDELKKIHKKEKQITSSLTCKLLKRDINFDARIKEFIKNVAKYDKKISGSDNNSNLLTYFINSGEASFIKEILDDLNQKSIKELFEKITSRKTIANFFNKIKNQNITMNDEIILKWLLEYSKFLNNSWIESLLQSPEERVWDIFLDSNICTNEFFDQYFLFHPNTNFASILRNHFFHTNYPKYEEIVKRLIDQAPRLKELFEVNVQNN